MWSFSIQRAQVPAVDDIGIALLGLRTQRELERERPRCRRAFLNLAGSAEQDFGNPKELDFVRVSNGGLTVVYLDQRLALALELDLNSSGIFVDRAGGHYNARDLIPAVKYPALSNMVDFDIERHQTRYG